jgi:hypothetical protein
MGFFDDALPSHGDLADATKPAAGQGAACTRCYRAALSGLALAWVLAADSTSALSRSCGSFQSPV